MGNRTWRDDIDLFDPATVNETIKEQCVCMQLNSSNQQLEVCGPGYSVSCAAGPSCFHGGECVSNVAHAANCTSSPHETNCNNRVYETIIASSADETSFTPTTTTTRPPLCVCPQHFSGQFCEVDMLNDPCYQALCETNHSTCRPANISQQNSTSATNDVMDYYCACAEGFAGIYCELRLYDPHYFGPFTFEDAGMYKHSAVH